MIIPDKGSGKTLKVKELHYDKRKFSSFPMEIPTSQPIIIS
jgi:hypothetical protein